MRTIDARTQARISKLEAMLSSLVYQHHKAFKDSRNRLEPCTTQRVRSVMRGNIGNLFAQANQTSYQEQGAMSLEAREQAITDYDRLLDIRDIMLDLSKLSLRHEKQYRFDEYMADKEDLTRTIARLDEDIKASSRLGGYLRLPNNPAAFIAWGIALLAPIALFPIIGLGTTLPLMMLAGFCAALYLVTAIAILIANAPRYQRYCAQRQLNFIQGRLEALTSPAARDEKAETSGKSVADTCSARTPLLSRQRATLHGKGSQKKPAEPNTGIGPEATVAAAGAVTKCCIIL